MLCVWELLFCSVYYLNFLRDDARYCSVKLSFKELLMVAFDNKERGEGGNCDIILLGHDLRTDRICLCDCTLWVTSK